MRLTFILAVVLSCSACAWRALPDGAIGEVDRIAGTPRVIRGERYIGLGPGSLILPGDSMIAGESDMAEVILRDRTMLVVGGGGQVTVVEYTDNASGPVIRLTSSGGRYRLKPGKKLKQDGALMTIATPVVSVISRGADLSITHADARTELEVVQLGEGAVEIENEFGRVLLDDPGGISVARFGRSPVDLPSLHENQRREIMRSFTINAGP